MIGADIQGAYEAMAAVSGGDAGALAIGLRRQVTAVGLRALAAKLLHVAAFSPERLADTYDNAAAGWLSRPVFAPRFRAEAPLSPQPQFWREFWRIIEAPPGEARSGEAFTLQTARLAGLLSPTLNARVAAAALRFPGVAEAAAGGLPPPFDPAELAACPAGTLGGAFQRTLIAGGASLEALDRDLLQLSTLPPPLDYVNTSILQCHMLWAIVGGYSPAQLDQLALSAFSMGQFGHHHSALVLAMVMTSAAVQRPPGVEFLLDAIFRGWLHGRETPPLLGVPWDALWLLPVDTVRESLGVKPFDSPLTAAARQLARGASGIGANRDGPHGRRPPRPR